MRRLSIHSMLLAFDEHRSRVPHPGTDKLTEGAVPTGDSENWECVR